MICGMVTTLLLIFGVFDIGSDPAKVQKVDNELAKRKEARDEADRADTIDEMLIELASLRTRQSSSILESVSICEKRIDVSGEILAREFDDPKIRQRAISEGLLARVKLYGIDFINDLGIEGCSEDLETAYLPYLDDEDSEVYSNARVALLTHRSFEQLKSKDGNVDELFQLFSDTIRRFDKDDYVAPMIEAHLFVLVEKEPEYAANLFRRLREKNPVGTLSPNMEERFHNIADLLLLKAENFERKFANRWANGKTGRAELVATASRLLDHSGVGISLVKEIAKLSNWFEQNEFLEEAQSVYQAIVSSVKNENVLQEYRSSCSQLADAGLKRCDLKGQKVEYRGMDSVGMPLMADELNRNVTLVVYWSAASKRSLLLLDSLNESARQIEKKPVSSLAVCVDEELPQNVSLMKSKSSSIRLIKSKLDGETNPLLEACPPGPMPHLMLVNFGGVVENVNLDATQAMDKVIGLLINRRR